MNAKGALRPVRLQQNVRPLQRYHRLASLLGSARCCAARHRKGAQLLAAVLKKNAAQCGLVLRSLGVLLQNAR